MEKLIQKRRYFGLKLRNAMFIRGEKGSGNFP